MKLLEGKKALIFGVANKNSIAWGIAQALHAHGCELGFSYGFEQLERRVRPLADELGVEFVEECNIEKDDEIEKVLCSRPNVFGTIFINHHKRDEDEATETKSV